MSSWHSRTYGASRVASGAGQHRKYRVGTSVRLLGNLADPRSKDRKTAPKDAWFQITQLLPAERLGFQYRVKNMVTGLEFVIVEDQIASDIQSEPDEAREMREAY